MIYVKRIQKPEEFTTITSTWIEEWQTKHQQKTASQFWAMIRQRKGMKRFSERLIHMFYGKCAFCESTIRHVAYPHIEHFYPKGLSEFQHLICCFVATKTISENELSDS